jgi:hypothetical protein
MLIRKIIVSSLIVIIRRALGLAILPVGLMVLPVRLMILLV